MSNMEMSKEFALRAESYILWSRNSDDQFWTDRCMARAGYYLALSVQWKKFASMKAVI